MAEKALDKERVGVLIDRLIADSQQMGTSRLSRERERVNLFYTGEYPKRQSAGSSSYVSTDVYDSVEAMKAQLLETFANGTEIVKFDPQGPDDVEPSRIATEYASYVVFRQNDGFGIFHDVIDDGLKARVGVVKVYWDQQVRTQDETFEQVPQEDVEALASQEDIEDLNAELDDTTGGYSGTLTRKVADLSQVRIEPIAPEEFGIESQAKCLEDSFHYHRTLKTIGELEEEGLDIKPLKDTAPDAEERLQEDVEKAARFSQLDSGFATELDKPEGTRRYKVYECYIKLASEKGKRPRLHKVIRVAGKTLDIQEVDRSPFKVFVPLRVAHSFYGNNFAARVIPTQNARTTLTRGILDHTNITNNPRYTVLQGGLTNPREMLDNRLGGLVNITRPDAVNPLLQASLNPFVYQTLEMLKVANEETTGISSLSQGLNKDAISTQNSQGLVNDLVALSQVRQKVVARNFAAFVKELFIEVYQLVIENENRQSVIEVAGQWLEIDPRRWQQRKAATVALHLGTQEKEQEAQNLMMLLTMAAQDPDLQRMVGEEGKYNVATEVLTLKGRKDHARFIKHPSQLPPPQPDPMVMKKMELEERTVAVSEMQAQTDAQKVMAAVQKQELDGVLAQMKLDLETLLKMQENHRKNVETANAVDVAQRELEVVEAAPAVEPAKGIASPNS